MPGSGEDLLVLDADFIRDPYPTYAKLRAASGARKARLPSGQRVWIIAGYEEGRAALVDPRLSKQVNTVEELFERHFEDPSQCWKFDSSVVEHMLNSDPPDHTRLRRLVNKAFTPARVEALRPRIVDISTGLLDVMARGPEVVDLIDAFAHPLPTTVICELLGIPEDNRADFRSWSHTIVNVSADRQPERMQADSAAMAAYLTKLVADKRAQPVDDMLTALIQATDDGDQLTEVELISMAFLLLVAGHETTVSLIGNGMLALLRHPEQRAALMADPSLIPAAIEEFLRYEGPVNQTTGRFTVAPMEVGDVTIPAGEFVMVALSSANRDPRQFPDSDRLDVTRPAAGHLAFGHGIHYCLGAPLARQVLLVRHPPHPPSPLGWDRNSGARQPGLPWSSGHHTRRLNVAT